MPFYQVHAQWKNPTTNMLETGRRTVEADNPDHASTVAQKELDTMVEQFIQQIFVAGSAGSKEDLKKKYKDDNLRILSITPVRG